MTDSLPVTLRGMTAADADAVRLLVAAAFADEPDVVALQDALALRPDNVGFVADHEGRVVGHVGLTRCWIDAPDRLVSALVLGPLSVSPDVQRRGIGAELLERAVAHARSTDAPAVFLEGDPAYYSRHGWLPASAIGVTPPSVRIPRPAFQCVRLPAHEDWMRGAVVYPDTFWLHDSVGLRGERLAAVLERLGRG